MAATATRGAVAPGTKGPKPTYAPNQTLYISNLPSSKIQKDDLRRSLYTLFSTYGSVLDVVALRTMKMRGQAHITYKDVQTATQAMRALQKFDFFGRELDISYAKSKSHFVAKLDGTFKMEAPAGEVTATELQQSIFNGPPSAAMSNTATAPAPGTLKPPGTDHAMEDARSPTTSVAGQKRRRDTEDEADEDSEGDVAMEEDSDDE
ncbi:U2 small nuclear ribonucleoprotein B [Hyphodiscus hymeniophilus]|uniref:U2 small nuclear ribonucleoprotein B n=1 Tax=Hyphodiscus hymeniophilus TaxID=353542 RepID=A0A9P6VN81_9HELO|nr:U2 small nuclear ribonucleoprotein B [Hyphodiscus hymeniophilus]